MNASAALQRTPLFEEHRGLQARLTDFGGWEMPLHYGSQVEEHHHVRRDAGMFDVSHMLAVDVAGEGARGLLEHVLANDVARLTRPGRALYSCMLRDDGGVLDDLIVYLLGDGCFRLVVNAATAAKDEQWLRTQRDRLAPAAAIEPRRDLAILAVQGPEARGKVWRARPETRAASEALAAFSAVASADMLIARTGYTGEDGFEIMLPAQAAPALWRDLLAAGVAPCGLAARDTLRLEAGMNLYGQDMDETTTPMETGLAWTVDFRRARDFIGRHALERRTPRFELRGLVLRDKGVLRSHQRVRTAAGEGEITSGTFAPSLGRSVALARLPPACRVGDPVEVAIRERWLAAEVVNYPFVRMGKALLPA